MTTPHHDTETRDLETRDMETRDMETRDMETGDRTPGDMAGDPSTATGSRMPADDLDTEYTDRDTELQGSSTAATAAPTPTGMAANRTDPSTDGNGHEPLVSRDRAEDYSTRWNEIKGAFVDEPRQAVGQADELVGQLLDELEELFRKQRRDIEQGLDADETSTEDLRQALRRYRSFFDRLLSL